MQRSWQSPKFIQLDGQFITLKPLVPERDVEALYLAFHGTSEKEAVWDYLPYGSFDSPASMKSWMEADMVDRSDPLVWTVFENTANTQVGIVGLLAIVPEHGRAEIGHVWFTPAVHKSKVNTESQYYCFVTCSSSIPIGGWNGNAMPLTTPAAQLRHEWDLSMKVGFAIIWLCGGRTEIPIGSR